MLQWQMAMCGKMDVASVAKLNQGKKCVVLALFGNMILCEMDVCQTREVD